MAVQQGSDATQFHAGLQFFSSPELESQLAYTSLPNEELCCVVGFKSHPTGGDHPNGQQLAGLLMVLSTGELVLKCISILELKMQVHLGVSDPGLPPCSGIPTSHT